MPKNTQVKERESFMLEGHLSELTWEPKSEEQVRKDLFKGSDPDKMVDSFEQQLGLDIKNTTPRNQIYKCVFLSPCTSEEDQLLLQKFYNNTDQYVVAHRSDNWTQQGTLKIFLEYYEDLDIKQAKELTEAPTSTNL